MGLDFLAGATSPDAELVVVLPDSTVERIRNVSTDKIRQSCPLLFYAFEDGLHSMRQASINVTSIQVAVSFLRFLYTGDYLGPSEEAHNVSLILHAELYKMAHDFEVPHLKVSAYVNFMRSTEWSCSVPTPPLGLCETIEFTYKHLDYDQPHQQQRLVDALLNYCISSYKYHGLGDDPAFCQMAFNIPVFQKQLCETSMARDFQHDGAADIIRLLVCKPTPQSHRTDDTHDVDDFHFDPWSDEEDTFRSPEIHIKEPLAIRPSIGIDPSIVLALPSKHAQGPARSSESESSSSDEEGFALVRRPQLIIPPSSDHSPINYPMSSPELVSATISDDDRTVEIPQTSVEDNCPSFPSAVPVASIIVEPTSDPFMNIFDPFVDTIDPFADTSDTDDWSFI